jgi:hypothetical protein
LRGLRVGGRRRASREQAERAARAAAKQRVALDQALQTNQPATSTVVGRPDQNPYRATSRQSTFAQPRSLAAIVQGVNDGKKSRAAVIRNPGWSGARGLDGAAQGGLVVVASFGRDGGWGMGNGMGNRLSTRARRNSFVRSFGSWAARGQGLGNARNARPGREVQGMQGMQGLAGWRWRGRLRKRSGCVIAGSWPAPEAV